MTQKLKTKYLINIGIFSGIYFIIMFALDMMRITPVMFLIYPFFNSIVGQCDSVIFMAKTLKTWLLFIFVILQSLIMFLTGHIYVLLFHAIVIIGIAEIIFRTGKFRSFKFNVLANAVFCWICDSFLQMIFVKEQYMEMIVKSMYEEFDETL